MSIHHKVVCTRVCVCALQTLCFLKCTESNLIFWQNYFRIIYLWFDVIFLGSLFGDLVRHLLIKTKSTTHACRLWGFFPSFFLPSMIILEDSFTKFGQAFNFCQEKNEKETKKPKSDNLLQSSSVLCSLRTCSLGNNRQKDWVHSNHDDSQ